MTIEICGFHDTLSVMLYPDVVIRPVSVLSKHRNTRALEYAGMYETISSPSPALFGPTNP